MRAGVPETERMQPIGSRKLKDASIVCPPHDGVDTTLKRHDVACWTAPRDGSPGDLRSDAAHWVSAG